MFKNNAAKQQAQRLEQERKQAQTQADTLKAENQKKTSTARRRLLGRSSLIATSDLGVTDKLG